MTQTTTDYLFQATTAVPDRTYSATATNGGLGKFDDHLSQASSFAGGDSQSVSGGTQRTDSSRRDDDSSKWNSGTSSSSSNGSSSSSSSSRSDQENSRDTVSAPSSSSDNSRSDEHDDDKSNDTTAAEAAGASQPVKQSAKPVDSKTEHSEKSEASKAVKATAANKKTAELNAENKPSGTGDGKTPANASGAEAQHAEEAAKLAAKVAEDESKSEEQADAANAAENKNKQEKTASNGATKVKAKAGASRSEGAGSNNDAEVHATGSSETATEAATTEQAKSDAAPAVAAGNAAKRESESDNSLDGDSKDSKADAPSGARSDAVTAAAKVDAAQLAGGAASAPNANPNASPKGKDNIPATKPIEAKGEAPAVVFARMSRQSNSDASSSTKGENEGPQVDPSRFIGRVAKAFQTAQDRGGTLQLRLSPPELGALRIELNVKDGVMSASLQTDNANARKLLLDHLPALRDRLADQNIRVDRFDVDVRQDGSGAQADARGWQQRQPQHQPDQSSPRRQPPTQPKVSAMPPVERVASTPIVGNTGLNLIV